MRTSGGGGGGRPPFPLTRRGVGLSPAPRAPGFAAEGRACFGVDVPLRGLLAASRVAGRAAAVQDRLQRDEPPPAALELPVLVADRAGLHQPFPLTDVQQAYWIGRSG